MVKVDLFQTIKIKKIYNINKSFYINTLSPFIIIIIFIRK